MTSVQKKKSATIFTREIFAKISHFSSFEDMAGFVLDKLDVIHQVEMNQSNSINCNIVFVETKMLKIV